MPAVIARLGMLWLLVCSLQMLWGIPGWTRDVTIQPSKIRLQEESTAVWRAPLPSRYKSFLTEQRGVVLLDGQVSGRPAHSVKDMLRSAGGMYYISRGTVRWSREDGATPKGNQNAVAVRLPWPMPWWYPLTGLIFVAGGWWFMGRRDAGHQGSGPYLKEHPWQSRWRILPWTDFWTAVVLALLATSLRMVDVSQASNYNDGIMSIRGLPYSDAHGWNELAQNVALGRGLSGGFDGQRPFYSLLIAMLHLVRGLHFENGLIVNALCHGLAVGLIYCLGRIIGSRTIGACGALLVFFSGDHTGLARVVMTETPGFALTTLALVLAVVGESAKHRPGDAPAGKIRRGIPWLAVVCFLLSGLFQALGNLTCPFTLAAMPFYGMLLLGAGRRLCGRWITWRILQPGLWFSVGFLLVMTPWVVRQQKVHGVTALSLQTAELLYGATFPEGPLKETQMRELEQHQSTAGSSRAERYAFSLRRYQETVKQHPGAYASLFWKNLVAFFSFHDVSGPEPELAAVLVLLAGVAGRWRDPRRLCWLAAGVLMVPLAVVALRVPFEHRAGAPLFWLGAGSLISALWLGPPGGRRALLWLAATVAGCAVINALTGNLIARRCWVFCDWCLWLIVLAACRVLLDQLALLLARIHPSHRGTPRQQSSDGCDDCLSTARRFSLGSAALILVTCAAGGTGLLIRQFHPVPPPRFPEATTLSRAHAWALRNVPELASHPGTAWDLYWIVPDDAVCRLPAEYEPSNFSRAFLRQPYSRTLRYVRMFAGHSQEATPLMMEAKGLKDTFQAHHPGLLVAWSDGDPDAWLGHDRVILKAAAFLPGTSDGLVNEDQAILFPQIPDSQ